MKEDAFLTAFESLVNARGGVARLRAIILELAVAGRLTDQNPLDEPAAAVLERVNSERETSVLGHRIRKPHSIFTGPRTPPNPIPFGWALARITDISVIVRGVTYSKEQVRPSPAEGFTPLLRANNIQQVLSVNDLVYVENNCVVDHQRLSLGDIVVCMSSGSASLVGKSAVVTAEAEGHSFGAFCAGIKPLCGGPYLALALRSPWVIRQLAGAGRGIGINNLRIEDLRNALIPIPPVAEQDRIVAHVAELMVLCVELEREQEAAEELRAATARSGFNALVGADPSDSKTPELILGEFFEKVLSAGEGALEVIGQLRSAILSLAVTGRLVAQDDSDNSARDLVRSIQTQFAALGLVPGPSRKSIEECVGVSLELIPANWCATELGSVAWLEYGKSLPKGDRNSAGAVPVYGANGVVGTHTEALVNQPALVIGRKGSAGAVNVSNVPFWPTDVTYFVVPQIGLSLAFLNILFLSLGLDSMARGIKPGLDRREVHALLVGIPPSDEQTRIAARVDDLMALCDELEREQEAAEELRVAIGDSVISSLRT